ncbi:AAA family ATPase [Robertmurraya sp. GLU-23]
MNFKLKGIELEAFRIYQDRQLFNFLTKSGEVANLIVIYGPNGYGKTSFIDGVEWVLTGSINRISNNSILKNTAESEKGEILKNRKSGKEYGTVRLIADNGQTLEKNTKVIGKNGRKTDYAEGDLISNPDIFSNINFSEFSTQSILGQDKIDSFLRSVTPKDRYDTLTNFWDDANDSELFKSILGMNIESEKKQKNIREQLQEINKEIESLVLRSNIIIEINNLVKKFNQTKLEDLDLPEFSKSSNAEAYISLIILSNSRLKSKRLKVENKLLTSEYLVQNFELYNNKKNELVQIKEDIEEINTSLTKFNNREERLNYLNVIVSQIYVLIRKYKSLKELLDQFNNFQEILKKISKLEESNSVLTKEISKFNTLRLLEEQQLTQTKNELATIMKMREDTEKNYSKLDINLEYYNSLQNRKSHLSKRSIQIKDLISIRWNNKQEIMKNKLKFESLRTYDVKNIININNEYTQFGTIINQIKESYEIKVKREKELKQLELEYTKLGELNEQLNTIFKVGKKFIEDSRSVSCPLCKKEYENFETLIKNVDKNFLEVDSLNRIRKEIEGLTEVIKEEDNNLNKIVKSFRLKVEEEINNLLETEMNNEEKIISNNIINDKINSKLNKISLEEENLISFFENLGLDVKNNDQIYINDFKYTLNSKLINYNVSIEEYNKKVNEKFNNHTDFSKTVKLKEQEIQSNKNRISELKENNILNRVNKLIEDLNVESNIDKIQEVYEMNRQDLLVQLNNRRIILNQINILNKELGTINLQEKKTQYEEKQKSYQEFKNYIDSYELKFKTLLEKDVVTEAEVEIYTSHENLVSEINRIDKGISVLNELNEFTKYIENNIALKNKESKKRDLEEELTVLIRGSEELLRAKEYITNHIKNKIGNTFNLDSINSIYQRIDPHPDFNNIAFETDFTKEKPELNIYASSREEKLAPILYFSAAQVNILSLSIFLAKGLIMKEEGLNTIFMDDPIQHLDNLNILSFIDLLRTITNDLDKQVILSTHNENFYKLIKRKMDPSFTKSKFIELESFGKIK